MATRLLGFFPRTAASDFEVFLAGLVELLAAYPAFVVEAALSVRDGLPGRSEFAPTLAEVRGFCEGILVADARHQETLNRYRPRIGSSSDASPLPPLAAHASASALCARFGIREVPLGWDAIDLTRAAARYGAGLQEALDNLAEPVNSRGMSGAASFAAVQRGNERVIAEAHATAGTEPAGAWSASPLLADALRAQGVSRPAAPPDMQRAGALARRIIGDAPPAEEQGFPVDASELPF